MKKEEILDKKRYLRDLREKEIFGEQSNDAKSVENVQYLGTININGIEEEIFLMTEQNNGKMQYTFINDRGERIAKKSELGVILAERTFSSVDEGEALKEALEELSNSLNDKSMDLSESEKERNLIIAEQLGLTEDEIEKMEEVDLDQKLKEKQQEQKDEDENKEIDKEEIRKIRTLQESKTDVKVDERQTLGQKLKLEEINEKPGQKFVKFAVVYSEKLKEINGENGENTGYAFVGIREDGSAQRLDDILEMDRAYGNTNTENVLRHNENEKSEIDNKTNSRYRIKGTDETLAVKNGQYGELEVFLGGKEKGSNNIAETQLETRNVRPTSRELRETQSDRKGEYYRNKQIDEATGHFKMGEEELDIKDTDGNRTTKTHVHDNDVIEGTDITYIKLANACGYGNDAEHAKKVFKQAQKDNADLSSEKLVKKIIEDKEEEFREIRNRNH